MNWQTLPGSRSGLGESPFWHPLDAMLYWVDIPGMKILRSNVFMGTVEVWQLAQEPGCIAPALKGGLVLALRDGIYRAPQWGGALTQIEPATHDTATTRFNDGKCDSRGRLWAGTMYEPRTAYLAELLCLDRRPGQTPSYVRKLDQGTIANGLAWSPDERTMYWANTTDGLIWAWDYESHSGALSNRRVFQHLPPKPADWTYGTPSAAAYGGRPDGCAVDVEGNYYSAMYEGKRIVKYAPDGRQMAVIATPAQCPTMPCFGGDDMQTLYVTTACKDRGAAELADQPDAGCVFSMRVDVPGLPVNFYED